MIAGPRVVRKTLRPKSENLNIHRNKPVRVGVCADRMYNQSDQSDKTFAATTPSQVIPVLTSHTFRPGTVHTAELLFERCPAYYVSIFHKRARRQMAIMAVPSTSDPTDAKIKHKSAQITTIRESQAIGALVDLGPEKWQTEMWQHSPAPIVRNPYLLAMLIKHTGIGQPGSLVIDLFCGSAAAMQGAHL